MSKEPHPTLFVLEGVIQHYEEGTMLELYSNITQEEWLIIIEETVKYKVFLECLKEVACPGLNESWDDRDDWYRIQLEVAVSRMRNIDPLAVAKYDQKAIKSAYTEKMLSSTKEIRQLISEVRENKNNQLRRKYDINVSNL